VATVLDLRGLDSTSRTAWSTETLYQRLALRRQLEGVDAVQTISLWMAEQVSLRLNVARERIHLTYPIAEAPLHRILPGPQGNFALALGHLEPRKNLEVLVDATADADWPKGFPLLVAGRDAGSQRNLEDRSSQLKAPVHLLGAVSDASRGQLLSTATVVLVPSVYEGFGMVPIEAVLAGRPALVSDRGPLPEVVGVQESVLPAHDAHAWATKVREIHASPHVARALHQRQLAAARRFSREAVAGQLNALYAAVCSQE
jgi:glycosyltransferase involved in cell wall biosynthesis